MLTWMSQSFIITIFGYCFWVSGGIQMGVYLIGGGMQLDRQCEPPWEGRVLMKLSTVRLRLEIQESKFVNLNYSGSTDLNLGSTSLLPSSSLLYQLLPSPYSSSPDPSPSPDPSSSSSSSSFQSSSQSQSQSSSPSQSPSSSSSSSPSSSSSQFSSSSSSLFYSSSSLIIILQFNTWQIVILQLKLTIIFLQVSNMNIYSIAQQVQALQQIGITIDTPQRLKLELALLRLSQLANADQLLFWGKITTTTTPYYIAQAIDFKGHYSFPHKKFYYSKDNFVFTELPQLDQYNREQANLFNTIPFTGNPQTILVNIQTEGEEKKEVKKDEEEEEEEEAVKIIPKNYTEEDRLAYTVHAIQTQCQIVPIGAFRMIAAHQIRYNEQFQGVKAKQFGLQSFVHFRYPLSLLAKQKIESVQAVFSFDLFDKIQNSSYWSAQLNTSQSLGTVRSFIWPGYVGYTFLNRHTFGGIYHGNGLKQVELSFYI